MSNDFNEMLYLSFFIMSLYCGSKLAKSIHLPPIVAEIIIGILFGPYTFNILTNSDYHILKLAGEFGIALLMLESGMHTTFDTIKQVIIKASFIAIVGGIIPFGIAFSFIYIFKYTLSYSIIGATVLVPTSIGIALELLNERGDLDTDYGKIIVSSAFLDDMFAIMVFSIVNKWADGNIDAWSIISVLLFSILFFIVGITLSIRGIPKLIGFIKKKFAKSDNGEHIESTERMIFFTIFIFMIAGSVISSLFGSFLLGSFITGVMFSDVIETQKIWKHQLKRILKLLMKFFFASTVGFAIPIHSILSITAFWQGLVIAVTAGFIGKCLTSLKMNKGMAIGIAMAGRGEFAFLMAETFYKKNLINAELYSCLLWSLLVTIIFTPIFFKYIVNRDRKVENNVKKKKISCKIRGNYHHSIIDDIIDGLEEMNIKIIHSVIDKLEDNQCSISIDTETHDTVHMKQLYHNIMHAMGDESEDLEINIVTGKKLEKENLELEENNVKKLLKNEDITIFYLKTDHHNKKIIYNYENNSRSDQLNNVVI